MQKTCMSVHNLCSLYFSLLVILHPKIGRHVLGETAISLHLK